MELKEKRISTRRVFDGRIINLRVDEVLTPGGTSAEREIVEHRGGAGIVAVDEDERILLVEQYRCPYDEITLEIPAGKIDENEKPELCAARELAEETGYTAKSIISFGKVYPSPGYTDEVIHLYLAEGLSEGSAHPDEDEFLNLKRVALSEALEMIGNGTVRDAKTVIGIMRYALKKEGKL